MAHRKNKKQDALQGLPSPQAYSRYNAAYAGGAKAKVKGQGLSVGKQVAISILLILLTAGIIAGVVAYLFITQLDNNLKGSYDEEATMNIQEQLVPVTSVDQPFYIMLIGSDERADNDEMGARSDTNIVVRVDPTTWTVTMISIPRDTKITYHNSTMKFNATYLYGGGSAGPIEAATDLLGVGISHFAEVNFDGVVALVDALGGVTVDVPQPIDDPQAGWVTIDQAGVQTLSGAQALVFARSRHYYTDGDFSRTQNQRALIEAIVEKVSQMSLADMPTIISKLTRCVTTDMSVADLYNLAALYKNSGAQLTIYSAMLPSTTADVDGVSYVVVDETDLKNMMDLVEAGQDPNTVTLTSGSRISGTFEHYDYTEGYD